ncbi:BON domain-containing protein [Planctopirus hydrillae]|nr:BON domain-containing protein [Planctopirus hydrillae]
MISPLRLSGESPQRTKTSQHVAAEIDQMLHRSPYKELQKLNVTCEDRVARITGFVSSYFTKLIAAEEIQMVTPVGWRVYNHVVVRSPSQETRS